MKEENMRGRRRKYYAKWFSAPLIAVMVMNLAAPLGGISVEAAEAAKKLGTKSCNRSDGSCNMGSGLQENALAAKELNGEHCPKGDGSCNTGNGTQETAAKELSGKDCSREDGSCNTGSSTQEAAAKELGGKDCSREDGSCNTGDSSQEAAAKDPNRKPCSKPDGSCYTEDELQMNSLETPDTANRNEEEQNDEANTTVDERTPQSIRLATLPNKTVYRKGEEFRQNGLSITAFYEGDDKAVLRGQQITVSGIDTSTAGNKTATVTYKGQEVTFAFQVLNTTSQIVDGIQVNNDAAPTISYGGEEWIVLGYKGVGPVTEGKNLTLFSQRFTGGSKVYYSPESSNEYKGSGAYNVAKRFATDHYTTPQERAAVVARNLNTCTNNDCEGIAGPVVQDAKFWSLSSREAESLQRNVRASWRDKWTYWLRSPGTDEDQVYTVCRAGITEPDRGRVHYAYGVRLATYLNPDSILVMTDSKNGKSSEASSDLKPVAAPVKTQKLTLIDKDLKSGAIRAYRKTPTGPSWDLEVDVRRAAPNVNVSATIVDRNGKVLYYGKIGETDASGRSVSGDSNTISLQLPVDISEQSGNKLRIFTEKVNETDKTDYGSKPVEFSAIPNEAPELTPEPETESEPELVPPTTELPDSETSESEREVETNPETSESETPGNSSTEVPVPDSQEPEASNTEQTTPDNQGSENANPGQTIPDSQESGDTNTEIPAPDKQESGNGDAGQSKPGNQESGNGNAGQSSPGDQGLGAPTPGLTKPEVPVPVSPKPETAKPKEPKQEEAVPERAESKKPSVAYPDVKTTDWFYGAVSYVTANRIMSGYANETFGASDELGRAQFATILYRMANSPKVKDETLFSDVLGGQFYSAPIVWASTNRIITGYENGMFGATDSITREQLATIMYRYAKYQGRDVAARADLNTFPDSEKVSSFAKEAVSWAVAAGIISGDQGKLNPQGVTSRAVAATIIQRFETKK